jgi:regulator of replication initiation timing
MSATPSNTPIDSVEDLEAQMAALQQKVQAARAEKARLAAEAEEKRLEEERLREEEKKKEAEETRRRLAAAKSSSMPSVSGVCVSRWVLV